ncbi:putative allantoate permease protein [Phaeoacremonium minimum UCRPA7]|uniref:Putative allantoate permease protein n=1 Tax=Phaeoacremonium minimum (strain UCR-PA7) TaxID=1286976 RepID=R8BBT9_PHAM7|nr:putative allantoate permease protein [Phaeoacremonium minimum UCRPA7]EON96760.1 putative allantoate permease protein [Phaeoacremonium minimum UCRPA7]
MFYKKSEQPLRNTITFGAYSSVINGLIGFAIGFIPAGSGSLLSWRWLFIVLGGVTVIWGIFVFFYLPDNPGNAKWLTPREKAMVVRRVSENQTGIQNKQWKWYQLRECLLDYRSWLLFFYIIGVTIPNGGLNTVFAARTKRFRTLIMAIVLLVPILGTILNIVTPTSNSGARLAGVYLIYTFYAGYMIALSIYQANTAGHTKKVTVSYLMYLAYAVGNIIGPQTFIAKQAPEYTGGITAMLVSYCVCICLAVGLGFSYWRTNKAREASEAEGGGFLDMTDKENKTFVYTS